MLLAVVLGTAGMVAWVFDTPADPPPLLVVEPEAFDLVLPPGEHSLVVHITNTAALPRQIVGLAPT